MEVGRESKEAVIIRTTFALLHDERQGLLALLSELVDETIDIQFLEAPELLCGIELEVYGQRIAWSLHHYLAETEDHLATLFRSKAAASAPAGLPEQISLALKREAQT
jgi:F-type H+-transporting ATPase subunit b